MIIKMLILNNSNILLKNKNLTKNQFSSDFQKE